MPELRLAFEAAIQGDTDEVRHQIHELGFSGHLLIIALAVIHTVVPYPAEIVNAAAGFAYGFFPALADRHGRLDDLGAASPTSSAPASPGRS